ncbi:hypothetical protein PBY51_003505 [Eleginops maclovinus]|uniref:Uncharacterized protein n=1 Tax=Eleginops maclovinus TaxID=56733 RepID=A0AAN8ASF0_ELEMC|nr:hypothetical protein PBY51_003505 [Eleginops maclovinus]
MYHPYGLRDTIMLAKKLPPLEEGGAGWLRALAAMTSGETLSLEDIRELLTQGSSTIECAEVERAPGVFSTADVYSA